MKVGLAQIAPKLGNLQANLQIHLDSIAAAAEDGVDLLVFPELSLTGYRVRDLVSTVALPASAENDVFAQLISAADEANMSIVVGFVEVDARYRCFLASAYIENGQILHVHRKVYLPTYGMFDDQRYFAAGDSVRAFDTRFGRMGLLICEDFWHVSPPYLLWMDGADILIMCSASPGRGISEAKLGSSKWVERVNEAYASTFTNVIIHANRVGFEDGVNYSGGSFIFDPDGNPLVQAPYHDEALVCADVDLNQLRRTRTRLPLLRDERLPLTLRELTRISSEI